VYGTVNNSESTFKATCSAGITHIGGAQVTSSLLTSADPGDFPGQASGFPDSLY
jgi:hypothetical protein